MLIFFQVLYACIVEGEKEILKLDGNKLSKMMAGYILFKATNC